MTCPRCGLADVGEPVCPRCGVVFAKLEAARARATRPAPAPAIQPPQPEESAGGVSLGQLAVAALLVAIGVVWFLRVPENGPPKPWLPAAFGGSPAGPGPALPTPRSANPPRPIPAPPTPSASALAALPSPATPADESSVAPADLKRANDLVARLNARRSADESDLATADELHARYPREDKLTDVLEGVLLLRATAERQRRRFPDAQRLLQRAVSLQPAQADPRLMLVALLNESGDFAAAESAARDALPLHRRADLAYMLAYALFRQDKNRDAIEAAQSSLAIADNSDARALLDTLQKASHDESGMREQHISHFHVRYDGDAHEDVGREILRQLEHHYATLVTTLDHEPSAPVPVILFSREQYVQASGAPVWSGGVYDGVDGRIRIPIGGLTRSLTPTMDHTLIHELTHAFLADRTKGAIHELSPVNEGFAQYMEGERTGAFSAAEQAAIVGALPAQHPQQCRTLGCVRGFYLGGLSFVEYLIGLRSMGGMNDLFRNLGETGNADQSFKNVYGQDYASLRRAWAERFR